MRNKHNERGFTLIEMMVAISIFSIIATICIGALLTAYRVNQKAQAMKVVMDNLNFALDGMTLKMKAGGQFLEESDGFKFAWRKPDGDPVWVYYSLRDCGGRGCLGYREGDSGEYSIITSPYLDVRKFALSFGEEGVSFAVILVEGEAIVGSERSSFAIETAVSERR